MPDDEEKKIKVDEIEESYQVGLSEEMSFSLSVGASYTVREKKAEISMRILTRLLKMGMKGLVISPTIPKKIRSKYGLNDSEMSAIWLSATEGGDDAYNPSRIEYEITDKINEFMKGGGKVILLEGLEMVELSNGFDKTVEFVKTLSDFAAVHNGIFLLSVNPTVFKKEKLATLEWQLEPLPMPDADLVEHHIDEGRAGKMSEYVGYIQELEGKLKRLQDERSRFEEDNKKLAESIISVSREMESMQHIMRAKDEEILRLKQENINQNSKIREQRLSQITGGALGDAGMEIADLEEKIRALEDKNTILEEGNIERDKEIKHLNAIIRERDETLRKKQETLKGLLSKVTNVEVRVSAPVRLPRPEKKITVDIPAKNNNLVDESCPTCGNSLTRVLGIGDEYKLFCEFCKKWVRLG